MSDKRQLEQYRQRQYNNLSIPSNETSSLPPNPTTIHHLPPPDTQRTILHLDIDCFYAQVHQLQDPSLTTKPLGITQKYLIVTANYEARKRGVTKLMSIKDATALVPDLFLINGEDLSPYRAASKAMLSVLRRYGPCEKLGMDEFFIDVTNEVARRNSGNSAVAQYCGHLHCPDTAAIIQDSKYRPMDLRIHKVTDGSNGDIDEDKTTVTTTSELWETNLKIGSMIAQEARQAAFNQVGLRTSAGIACNKLCAKLCSGIHKPNDQTILLPHHAAAFIALLPLRALPGIGHKTEHTIYNALLHSSTTAASTSSSTDQQPPTVSHLLPLSKQDLSDMLGPKLGGRLYLMLRGIDDSLVVEQTHYAKSVSVEDTFRGCTSLQDLDVVLTRLAPGFVQRLREEGGRRGGTLVVKWRGRGKGWQRSSASVKMPDALAMLLGDDATIIDGSNDPPPLPLPPPVSSSLDDLVVSTVRRLLINNLPSQFDLVLVSIGATNFSQQTTELNNNNNNNNNIGRYLTTKENTSDEEKEKERAYQDEDSDDDVWADLHDLHAGPSHQQKKSKRRKMMMGSGDGGCGKMSYKNEEAMAIEKMMESGGLDMVEGEVDEDVKLAMQLQMEESERVGGGGGGGGGGKKRKAGGRGPLDVFFLSSKK